MKIRSPFFDIKNLHVEVIYLKRGEEIIKHAHNNVTSIWFGVSGEAMLYREGALEPLMISPESYVTMVYPEEFISIKASNDCILLKACKGRYTYKDIWVKVEDNDKLNKIRFIDKTQDEILDQNR